MTATVTVASTAMAVTSSSATIATIAMASSATMAMSSTAVTMTVIFFLILKERHHLFLSHALEIHGPPPLFLDQYVRTVQYFNKALIVFIGSKDLEPYSTGVILLRAVDRWKLEQVDPLVDWHSIIREQVLDINVPATLRD